MSDELCDACRKWRLNHADQVIRNRTDDEAAFAEYERRIEPIRDAYLLFQHEFEAHTASLVAANVHPMSGILRPDIIERILVANLDEHLKWLTIAYQEISARIAKEIGIE